MKPPVNHHPTIVDYARGEEILMHIQQWQRNDMVHPLTCGTNSQHYLEGKILPFGIHEVEVVLSCPHCGYWQGHIPDIVKDYDDVGFRASMKRFL
jgi:hypothetical protein